MTKFFFVADEQYMIESIAILIGIITIVCLALCSLLLTNQPFNITKWLWQELSESPAPESLLHVKLSAHIHKEFATAVRNPCSHSFLIFLLPIWGALGSLNVIIYTFSFSALSLCMLREFT